MITTWKIWNQLQLKRRNESQTIPTETTMQEIKHWKTTVSGELYIILPFFLLLFFLLSFWFFSHGALRTFFPRLVHDTESSVLQFNVKVHTVFSCFESDEKPNTYTIDTRRSVALLPSFNRVCVVWCACGRWNINWRRYTVVGRMLWHDVTLLLDSRFY